jgi:NAD-dependent deacetylase
MKAESIPEKLADRFAAARRVAVLTGAGVSAESGVDTFRGEDGTWSKVNIEDVATPQAFARDPARVWAWYDERRVKLKQIEPNPAHRALAEMERRFPNFALITQNIDGLHAKAGSHNIIELHGNIWEVRDTVTGEIGVLDDAPLSQIPPRNSKGNLLRPNVVWFGEMLPQGAMEAAAREAGACDLFLVVGTSAVVQPAASLPFIAKRAGALVLEFTLHWTEISEFVDHTFLGKAGETLPPFLELLG